MPSTPLIAREADMARMFPAICPATQHGVAIVPDERQLFSRLASELDAGWQIIHRCAMGARGDRRTADFILLHRDYGIALLDMARPGEIDDPVAAMYAMLEEIGFTRRYPGHLAIIARRVAPGKVSDLAAFLAMRFAAVPVSTIADPTWPDWLSQRLTPEALSPLRRDREGARPSAGIEIGLRAPLPGDSWRAWAAEKTQGARTADRGEPHVAAVPAGARGVDVAVERIPMSRDAETRSPLWAGMALAVFVVAVVLVGIAVLSHGNGPSELMATRSAPPPQPAAGAPATSN
jgi:hypothetical protein